jgi:hypothetical protein
LKPSIPGTVFCSFFRHGSCHRVPQSNSAHDNRNRRCRDRWVLVVETSNHITGVHEARTKEVAQAALLDDAVRERDRAFADAWGEVCPAWRLTPSSIYPHPRPLSRLRERGGVGARFLSITARFFSIVAFALLRWSYDFLWSPIFGMSLWTSGPK